MRKTNSKMTAINKVTKNQSKKGFCLSRNKSSSRVWLGSGRAPKAAMRIAPAVTRTVPISEKRVKGSERKMVAQMELKTKLLYEDEKSQ